MFNIFTISLIKSNKNMFLDDINIQQRQLRQYGSEILYKTRMTTFIQAKFYNQMERQKISYQKVKLL